MCLQNRVLFRIIPVWALLIMTAAAQAQDIHFSQYYATPFNLNPALAGCFDGDYRFILNQRTQWRSVTVPYNTFGLSADASDLNPSPLAHNEVLEQLGGALSFYSDRAGDSRLSTTQFQLALSYALPLQPGANAHIVPGILIGLHHTGIDYSELNYDNQWNGLFFDPSLDAGESYARDARTYADLGLGVVYYAQSGRRDRTEAGISMLNLNAPTQSWFNMSGVKLDTRFNIHGRHRMAVKDEIDIEPTLLFMKQGSYREFSIGALGYYILDDQRGLFRSVYGGFQGRARDAGYVVAGMEYDNWNVGISYDINTSNLKPASRGRGGFEFSVIYVLRRPDLRLTPPKVCPDYL